MICLACCLLWFGPLLAAFFITLAIFGDNACLCPLPNPQETMIFLQGTIMISSETPPEFGSSSSALHSVNAKILKNILELEPTTNINGLGIKKTHLFTFFEIGCRDNMFEI